MPNYSEGSAHKKPWLPQPENRYVVNGEHVKVIEALEAENQWLRRKTMGENKVQRWHIKQVIVDPLDGMGVANLVEQDDGEVVLSTDCAALEAECKELRTVNSLLSTQINDFAALNIKFYKKNQRYREALEKIEADTSNRPGRELWEYYCNRLYKILMIAREALGGKDADKT